MTLLPEQIAPTGAVDEDDFDELEPPKINVKGLSPARAALATLINWRKLISNELDKLLSGHRDLRDHITRLEKEEQKAKSLLSFPPALPYGYFPA